MFCKGSSVYWRTRGLQVLNDFLLCWLTSAVTSRINYMTQNTTFRSSVRCSSHEMVEIRWKKHVVMNCNTYHFSIYCERYIFLTGVYF